MLAPKFNNTIRRVTTWLPLFLLRTETFNDLRFDGVERLGILQVLTKRRKHEFWTVWTGLSR